MPLFNVQTSRLDAQLYSWLINKLKWIDDIWSFKTMLMFYQSSAVHLPLCITKIPAAFNLSCVDHLFNSDWAEGYCFVVLDLSPGYLIKLKNISAIAHMDTFHSRGIISARSADDHSWQSQTIEHFLYNLSCYRVFQESNAWFIFSIWSVGLCI